MIQEVLAEIEARDGEGVLFVLDGWDELPGSPPPDSPLHHLIQPCTHSSLQRSAVMITSRPEASAQLHDLASSRVHIVGFTPEKVEEYFEESLNRQDAEALVKQVKDNPAIEGSCSLPLIATIIVTLFLRMGHQLPSTFTGIFEGLVLYCILRHCKARMRLSVRSLSSLSALPEELQQSFDSLCKLAFHGVLNNKILFTEQEVSALPYFTTLSLLQAVESFVTVGSARTYSFLHLSVQELLAAWHISRMPDDAHQSDSIYKLYKLERFAGVFRFYAGLTHFSAPWSKDFIGQIIASATRLGADGEVVLATTELNLVLECLHEVQDRSIYCYVGGLLKGRCLYSATLLSPVACHSLGRILPLAVPVTTSLTPQDEQCTILFTKGLQKGWSGQQKPRDRLSINISPHLSTSTGVQAIGQLVSSCGVQELWLDLCVFQPLTWHLVIQQIVTVLMTDCPLESLAISAQPSKPSMTENANWCEMLTKNKTLKALQLTFWRVEFHVDVPSIAEGLQHNSTLKRLNLCRCQLNDKGVKCVATALRMNESLETLDLTGNVITDEGVRSLAAALAKNTSLKTLDLSRTKITDVGMWFFAQVLIENTSNLKALDLSGNIITNVSGPCLADVVRSNTTLRSLDLSMNHIDGIGLGWVVGGLKHNCTLEFLQLDWYPDVFEPLTHALTVNKTVKLSDNYSWDDYQPPPGLAEKLMANGVLQQLLTITIERILTEFGPELTGVALIAMMEEWKEYFGYY